MSLLDAAAAPAASGSGGESEATGLPGLKTWRAVYLVVLASFILWLVLLFLLGCAFR